MDESNITFVTDSTEDDSDNSDNNLKIVESPSPKRKSPIKPTESEKLIIESIEDELERRLEEKAAKTNLNSIHVKNIIRHVVTNEHVLALIRKAENPKESDETDLPYEPKLTRAKAKELLSNNAPVSAVPWKTPSHVSEVQALLSEDLQEDSSGDEYVPVEEESEDDRDSSFMSDPPSVPPASRLTPTPSSELCAQTNWTEDGVFKIPPTQPREEDNEANIALRTRSKLCLTSTPLEVIEEAFIPPDITTDMYDMDCDNDDWMDFLKKFTRPLDEIAKATEDEEHDPEYNILADEDIDEVDKEELRVDKAVKVSRRELNNLIAELFDCAQFSELNNIGESVELGKDLSNGQNINTDARQEQVNTSEISIGVKNLEKTTVVNNEANSISNIEEVITLMDISMKRSQVLILEQQMRQHVQLLTQNFILMYKHPELHDHSLQMKEYLFNLKFLCEGKKRSMFYTVNLLPALKLVEDWQTICDSDSDDFKNMESHVKKTLDESMKDHYVSTFPSLILETISNSEVFLYTSLLPKVPFKSLRLCRNNINNYIDAEDHLIAMGLEQFTSVLKQEKKRLNKNRDVPLRLLCSYIHEYMMPHKEPHKIFHHINLVRSGRCANNPIKYYFLHKNVQPIIHHVIPLEVLQILPPKKRLPIDLPSQFRKFNYPDDKNSAKKVTIWLPEELRVLTGENSNSPRISLNSISNNLPANVKRRERIRGSSKSKSYKKLDPISKFVECLCRPSQIHKLLSLYPNEDSSKTPEEKENTNPMDNMLPSMPNLGTPLKGNVRSDNTSCIMPNKTPIKEVAPKTSTSKDGQKDMCRDFSTINSSSFQQPNMNTEIEFCSPPDKHTVSTISKNDGSSAASTKAVISVGTTNSDTGTKEMTEGTLPKDSTEDVGTPFMATSTTIKPPGKKEPSGAEKKRAKLRREFLANLSVSTPEDPEVEKQKNEMFALAYYDKVRESLELEDYHKVMQILNDHEEGDGVDLYNKIKEVLSPKYQELADEFLLFLREKEANAVGQLIPWFRMTNRSKFLRKLEVYFKDQPAQLRKIYKCLTELSQNVGVSKEKMKSTLLPMFKGNAVLRDLFLQNFLDETPPPSLLEGPYETIDITKEMARPDDEEIYETITVPDVEDKYGGPSCICNCHQIEDHEFKSRYRHCIRCGTRFINGKVYIQTGRGLRPATVSFLTSPNVDHNIRLLGKTPTTVSQRKKRSDTSPSKQVFPTKENADEESDDEIDGKKKTKKKPSKRKRPAEKSSKESKGSRKGAIPKKSITVKCNTTKFSSVSPEEKGFKTGNRKRVYPGRKSKGKVNKKTDSPEVEGQPVVVPDELPIEAKTATEEAMEWEDHPLMGESTAELKPTSPGHQTAESESEFCEESSQDNCESDSNSSISSCNNHSQSDSNVGEESSWKREEDKIILETFQKENDKENAFKIISSQLKNRTVPQISNRFQTLMTLLLETLGTS